LLAELSPTASEPRTFEPARRAWWRARSFSAALAAAALLMAAGLFYVRPIATSPSSQGLLREAVNDHLRVVYAAHPIEIESGGIHQVKPWFTGRLDFAPDIAFSGDADFPLVGGAIGYFVDRKAATFVFKRRLHTISCFVFRARDLPWPGGQERSIDGGPNAHVTALDGFHVVLWRDGDLGHALVSDVSEPELLQLATKLVRR
jgi:anti-sigma factor RsiW